MIENYYLRRGILIHQKEMQLTAADYKTIMKKKI